MELASFTVQNDDPLRPSGACEVGGHPARAELDRSGPRVKLTVRFGPEGTLPLPPDAIDCAELLIAGTAVPAAAVNLPGGGEALRARLGPELADALVGTEAGPPAGARQDPPEAPDADPLVALSKRRAEAVRQRDAHARRAESLQTEAAGLRERLEAVEAELGGAGETAAAHAERCSEIAREIRDLLDAEEA